MKQLVTSNVLKFLSLTIALLVISNTSYSAEIGSWLKYKAVIHQEDYGSTEIDAICEYEYRKTDKRLHFHAELIVTKKGISGVGSGYLECVVMKGKEVLLDLSGALSAGAVAATGVHEKRGHFISNSIPCTEECYIHGYAKGADSDITGELGDLVQEVANAAKEGGIQAVKDLSYGAVVLAVGG